MGIISYFPGAEPSAGSDLSSQRGHVADDSPAEARKARRAENVSIAALTRRGQSSAEMERLLRSRELDEDTVQSELERLKGVGLIDDAALAETIVRTQSERKGLGRSALVAELRRRKIDQEEIDVALEALDVDDEQARAFELAEKRAPQLHALEGEVARRRLTAFLMRKGYSGSTVQAAVDAALGPRGNSQRSGFGSRGATKSNVRFD